MGQAVKELLLIEDNPADAVMLRKLLEKESPDEFAITHLESAEEIDWLNNPKAFDVAMVDMGLPGLSGFEAVNFVQSRAHTTPIIILTGAENEQEALQATSMGVQDYLVKAPAVAMLSGAQLTIPYSAKAMKKKSPTYCAMTSLRGW